MTHIQTPPNVWEKKNMFYFFSFFSSINSLQILLSYKPRLVMISWMSSCLKMLWGKAVYLISGNVRLLSSDDLNPQPQATVLKYKPELSQYVQLHGERGTHGRG